MSKKETINELVNRLSSIKDMKDFANGIINALNEAYDKGKEDIDKDLVKMIEHNNVAIRNREKRIVALEEEVSKLKSRLNVVYGIQNTSNSLTMQNIIHILNDYIDGDAEMFIRNGKLTFVKGTKTLSVDTCNDINVVIQLLSKYCFFE